MAVPSNNSTVNTKIHGFGYNLQNVNFEFNPFFTDRWQKEGSAKPLKSKPNILHRQRYKCSTPFLKLETLIKCDGLLQVDTLNSSNEQEYTLLHEHSAPCLELEKKFRTAPDVVANAKKMLEAGA